MFNHEAYKAELTGYAERLAKDAEAAANAGSYERAARLHNIRSGVTASAARIWPHIQPDPKPEPAQSNGDKALDEFTDWLNAYTALTQMIATADTLADKPDSAANHELRILTVIRNELQRLAKKYPSE